MTDTKKLREWLDSDIDVNGKKLLKFLAYTAPDMCDELDALREEAERLRGALKYYADTFCEHSIYFEGCGKMHPDQCSGCIARAALKGNSND